MTFSPFMAGSGRVGVILQKQTESINDTREFLNAIKNRKAKVGLIGSICRAAARASAKRVFVMGFDIDGAKTEGSIKARTT